MIKIIIDSSSDYPALEAKSNNIEIIPIPITIGEKNFLDGVDLDIDTFYSMLISGDDFPKTAQPSPNIFEKIFKEAKKNNDDVICILLSSGLSGMCQGAHLAKNLVDYDNIYIVDSLTATIPIKVIADYASKLIKEGLTAPEIVEKLESIKSKVRIVACLDTLEYLYKGGRLNKAAAVVGELAGIKPVITVDLEGKVSVIGKCVGRNKSMSYILKTLNSLHVNKDFPIYGVYTYCMENCEKLCGKLKSDDYNIDSTYHVGPTIGTHVGPNAYGVVFVEE